MMMMMMMMEEEGENGDEKEEKEEEEGGKGEEIEKQNKTLSLEYIPLINRDIPILHFKTTNLTVDIMCP